MSKQLQYIVLVFLAFFSVINCPKLLANDLTIRQSSQLLSQENLTNQTQTNVELWLKILQQDREVLAPEELALIKSKIASSYFEMGNYEKAEKYWHSNGEFFRKTQQNRLLAVTLSDMAKAYLRLGKTRLATKRLREAVEIAKSKQFDRVLYTAYLTWSNIHKVEGKYLEAEKNLQESLKYAVDREEKVIVYRNLSQVFQAKSQTIEQTKTNIVAEDLDIKAVKKRSINDRKKALFNAKIALELSKNIESFVTVDALLQILRLGAEAEDFNPNPYVERAETILAKLPDSTHKVYSLIDLSEFKSKPVYLLTSAVTIADRLEDDRAASFALGRLGTYYERVNQDDLALDWTDKAILAASRAQTAQSLYQWYWQKGRIYNSLGETEKAIEVYSQAIASLQTIRGELAKTTNEKIDFTTKVEPVYRELLQLLLSNPTPQQLDRALVIRDLLQLSELENYFGDDCLEFFSESKTLPNPQEVFIHTLIFPQATHIILKQTDGVTHTKIDITQLELEKLVKQWRYSLEDRTEENYLPLSQKMYDLLIKPIESELSKNKLKTLIFVNDGILKNVPMAALYDGQKFLVENYAVTNSLNLNSPAKENPIFNPETKILAFGLSEETANFPALPYVEQEIRAISELVEVEGFLNSQFTPNTVKQELVNHNFRLIHFATHGEFAGTAEDSFLSTYQGQISLSNLEEILNQNQLRFPQNPIKLLVLSACETAAGNERAVLGLAGIAIRSRVVNVIGSLWSVNDRAAVYLVDDFYDSLFLAGMSPSEALRQTQIKMIGTRTIHPAIWSNLILIAS